MTPPKIEAQPVDMDTQQEKRQYKKGSTSGSSTGSPNKKKAKKKKQLEALEALILDPQEQEQEPASTSNDPPPAPKAKAKAKTVPVQQVGIEIIEGKPKSWWSKQNVTTLKAQAEIRGYRFKDEETKGKGFIKTNEQFIKATKFKKADYLKVLLGLLKL